MLGGEVDFLLCHHHPDAPTRFEADRFRERSRSGATPWSRSARRMPTGRPAWPLPGRPETADARCWPTARPRGSAASWRRSRSTRSEAGGLETVFTSHLAATLMIMAREGHGVAWLPLTLVEEDLARADLVRAGAEEFDIPIEIRLFRSRDGRNPAADALWNRLTGQRDDTA